MFQPLLTVIVPIYNVEKYLRRCLDSIIAQTFPDIEIVLVDDCGSDDSMAIAYEYAEKDKRLKIIHHTKNSGLGAARNTGLRNSSAPLVMFCDSDDFYDPEMCDKMIHGIISSYSDIAACGIKVIYEPGTEGIKESDDNYYKIKFSGLCEMNDDVRQRTDFSSCNKIFCRTMLESNDILFPEGLHFEDAYFVNACFAVTNKIFFINEYLYGYVRRSGSIMSDTFAQKKGMSIDHLKVAILLNDFMKRRKLIQKNRKYMGTFFCSSLDFALWFESDPVCREAIYELAFDFIADEGWSAKMFPTPVAQRIKFLKKQMRSKRIKNMALYKYLAFIKRKITSLIKT